jgi:kynurenine formamidase
MLKSRIGLCGLCVLCMAGCLTKQEPLRGRLVDLTYSFDSQTIYWPTQNGFLLEHEAEGMTEKGYFYSANRFAAAEHGGTHIDAPYHFSKEGDTLDVIPLDRLVGHGVVIDVSSQCEHNPDFQVHIEDLNAWEKHHGQRLDGNILLIRTGYGKRWPDRKRYLGTDEKGPDAIGKLHFLGLSPEAARWLPKERSPKAVGLDTASIDYGQSTFFESHVALFSKNIPALENVANLDQLPELGFTLIALPMKIRGGSGGPVRIVALLPN